MNDKLNTLEDIISLGLKFKNNWFRGHSESYNDLTPKIFRPAYYSPLHLESSGHSEHHIIEEFRRLAPSFGTTCPHPSNHLEWLILMQHYGAPTRLLDWTESIMVAAFFAVNDNRHADAEIWRLYPQKINLKSLGGEGYPILDKSAHLKYLASEPLHTNAHQLSQELGLDNPVLFPIAFYPVLSFPRITAQGSVFTIHPAPHAGNSLIEAFQKDRKVLKRYFIPSDRKAKILADLAALGINFRIILANLDGLSRDLCLKYSNPFWNGWGQPEDD